MEFDLATVRDALLNLGILIVSLVLHEWGHAYMADRLGDNTPRSQGRVTLSPLVHIDPIGTVLIPLLGFFGFFGSFGVIGWAKPVYTNPRNFKNGMTDQAWVTIAGPTMNFLIALFAAVGGGLAARYYPPLIPLFKVVLQMNIMLVVFNLLPIPPLDGSKFLMYWFGMSEETYQRFAQWGWILLLVLVNLKPFMMLVGVCYAVLQIPFVALFNIIASF